MTFQFLFLTLKGINKSMNKESLLKELSIRGINLTEKQVESLFDLMNATLKANENFNLTAITDEESFIEKMIFDSALVMVDNTFDNKKILDFGTGAGFPGLVIYILNPSINLTLLDSNSKKIHYLNDLCAKNNYNIECIADRGETFSKNAKEVYDYVVARAVAPLNILLETVAQAIKVNGSLIAMKGLNYEQEINDAKGALKHLGFIVENIYEYNLPSNGYKRAIIYLKKIKNTPNKYPRDYSEIKRKPL